MQELQKWFKNRNCNNNKFLSGAWNQDLKQKFNFSVAFRDDNISIIHSVHWIDSQKYLSDLIFIQYYTVSYKTQKADYCL